MLINKPKITATKKLLLAKLSPLLQKQWFYLLGIFTTLAIWHLDIIRNHPIASEEITFYTLYWGGILYLLWQNRHQEHNPSWFSSWLGLGLLFLVIVRPLHFWHLDLMLFRYAPIVAGLGLGLLSFGFLGFKHHWRLFLLLCLMLFPFGLINEIFDSRLHFSELTASISAFSLHYIGFKATYYGDLVKLPTGQVRVLYYCTGGLLILWLLKLTLLILVVVSPLTWRQRWTLVISAISVGFLTGCIRVALLVVVVNNKDLFDYWHSYTGGSMFMVFSTITYAFLCNWILSLENLSAENIQPIHTQIITPERRFFLLGTWVGIILTAIFLIATKININNSINLPDQLSLTNWQQINVSSLQEQKIYLDTQKFFIVKSGKNYSYINNNQQLDVEMRYMINTRGNNNPFLDAKNPDFLKIRNLPKKVIFSPKIGYSNLYSDGNKGFLLSCVNPRGGGTVNSQQFMQNRYQYDLSFNRFLPWIFGQDVLRDDRCLWTQLSVPVKGRQPDDIYSVLESIWLENYWKWQSLLLNK